ncbi:SCO family protein [Halovivax limisalsi]|uniref:SCO family protein n=1 Tax=Halovivax limisalsi TaxID=1453760 RepID=UPI001FFD0840|nr:SCO family protein [Halovivax limisalsi]
MIQTRSTAIDRRRFLAVAGSTAVLGSTAGCLERFESGDDRDDLVLSPPENHDRLADADLDIPIYGEALPEATVPAALSDRSVTTTEFVGERITMLTFIYTSCTTVCPGLTSSLRRVQADATQRGYADEIAFQTVTFDPEYDTPDVLRSYGQNLGVDFDVGNWYFLRPPTPEAARDVVTETFGVAFERGEADESTTGGEQHDEGHSDGESHDGHERRFAHTSLILLVNRAGFVERAYTGGPPRPDRLLETVRTVVEEG